MTHSTPTAKSAPTQPLTVRVARLIRAPREKLFDAWLTPSVMKQWWLSTKGKPLTHCEIDPRVGGTYTWKEIGCWDSEPMPEYPANYEWIMHGEFLEITRPKRVVFTWNVNHKPPTVNNRVTVEFIERGSATEVVITHEGILTTPMRDGTEQGWTHLMASLARIVE